MENDLDYKTLFELYTAEVEENKKLRRALQIIQDAIACAQGALASEGLDNL